MSGAREARRLSSLIAMLASHEPMGEKERRDRDLMLELARTLANPLSAEEETAHFTASGLVVDQPLKRFCLIRHRKLGRWLQPGGHIEPDDESVLAAATREVTEETSLRVRPLFERPLDLDVHEFPERDGRPAHLHLDCRFLLVAAEPKALQASDESAGARWFTLRRAAVRTDPGLQRMIDKVRLIT